MIVMMKTENLKRINLIAALLLTFPVLVNAQSEVILPLHQNIVIQNEIARQENAGVLNRTEAAVDDTLFLPFFDDFSVYSVWPSSEKWIDSSAFVNFNFPINPPTVGVATFDGLDKQGNPYNNTNANAIGLCDEMTSKYLNLEFDENGLPYNSTDSIFLVFYFQRKGRGDNPEAADSLTLQFFNPVTQSWNYAWSATGAASGDTEFTKVKISIVNPDYRQNGFRFRFRNYGSQTGLLDIWHVDYVFLNKFLPPDYDSVYDYAFVYEGTSLLNGFSSIPWKHYNSIPQAQQQSLVKTAANLTIRNNNDANPFPIKVAGTLFDQYGNPAPLVGGGGLNSIVIPNNTNVNPPANLISNNYFEDPAAANETFFTAVYDIGQTTGGGSVDDFPMNDTLKYTQSFKNYYAYDDGSAELAYGINGIGAQLAYKFTTLKGDTLRAVSMFFAQSGLNVSNQLFRLAVWTGTAAGPVGAPVYQKFNQSPNYIDSINGFYIYNTDPIYVPAGTWFFGFIQNNAVLLNLGLDVNTPADPSKKFINTSGTWVNSQLPGMWMIRPVFDSEPLVNDVPSADLFSDVSIFPVPASSIINIQTPNPAYLNYRISIADISGREVLSFEKFVSSIDVQELSSGLYFLQLTDPVSGKFSSTKIIVNR